MPAPERAPIFVHGSPEELRGRLAHTFWWSRPRVLPNLDAGRRYRKRAIALWTGTLVAMGIAAYLFGWRGFIYGTIASSFIAPTLNFYAVRALPIAADAATLWQQSTYNFPTPILVVMAGLHVLCAVSLVVLALWGLPAIGRSYLDLMDAVMPRDATILFFIAFFAMILHNIAALRFKWRHRQGKVPPGVIPPPRLVGQELKKNSTMRHVMGTVFLIMMPLLHELGRIWAAVTKGGDYAFNDDSIMTVSLVGAGLFASLVVWTTLRPLRRVRYYQVVPVMMLANMTGLLAMVSLFLGFDETWQLTTVSAVISRYSFIDFFFGSAFWFFAFYRNELYFPRAESA